MKKIVIYTCLIGCLLFMASCREKIRGISLEADKFVTCTQKGMIRWAGYTFLYEDETCQQVVNTARKTIRYQTDDQVSYVHMEFNALPFSPEADALTVIDVKLTYRITDKTISMSAPMIILRSEGRKVWLWNDEQKIGIIVDL